MWLSRLVAVLVVGMLTACTGLLVTPLGTNFAGDDLRVAVIETGGRNGQIYSRALNRLLGGLRILLSPCPQSCQWRLAAHLKSGVLHPICKSAK